VSGWQTVSLETLAAGAPNSLVDGPFGSHLKTSEYVDEGVPLMRIQNVKPNHFVAKDTKYITTAKARGSLGTTFVLATWS
jgi:type I restriction enzyme S subunit